MAKGSKRKSSEKLRALMRTQEINELLSKSITESEALQNSGDDRPVYDSHVIDLLDNKVSGSTSMSRRKPSKSAKSRSTSSRKPQNKSRSKRKR
jgi:hypothetical protein